MLILLKHQVGICILCSAKRQGPANNAFCCVIMRHFFSHGRMFPTLLTLLTRLGTLYPYGAQMKLWLCGCKLDSGFWRRQLPQLLASKLTTEQPDVVDPFSFFLLPQKSQPVRSKSKLWALPGRLPLCVKLKGIASLPLPLTNKRPTNPDSLTQKQSVKPAWGLEIKWMLWEQLAHEYPPKSRLAPHLETQSPRLRGGWVLLN